MKISKSFRYHTDLSVVKNAIETLLTYYKPDVSLNDIICNVEENSEKWEECTHCKGEGVVRYDIYKNEDDEKPCGFKFITCTACKGRKWVRKK
jgi:hypothetical protein